MKTVETPAQLRQVCQKPHYRTVGNWMARHITRDLAIYGTWLALHTPLRADSIALISLVCGFASALLLAIPNTVALVAGALMLQFWYYLDHVDGQVARYYKEADLTGTFFDFMIHFLVHTSVMFGLGMRMFLQSGSLLWLALGFLSALAMGGLSQFNDCKYKAFFARLAQWRGKVVLAGSEAAKQSASPAPGQRSAMMGLKTIYIFLYKLTEIHVFMNILTAVALLQFYMPCAQLANGFVWLYALLLPFVLAARMTHTIRNHRIDAEFNETFAAQEDQ